MKLAAVTLVLMASPLAMAAWCGTAPTFASREQCEMYVHEMNISGDAQCVPAVNQGGE